MAVTQSEPGTLDQCILREMERWDVPGIVVAVMQDGAIDARAFGVTSLDTNQPVSIDTLFQVGSITKVFTATLVLQLVEEGQVDLDAPVRTYLPDLRLADDEALRTITLRHLLSHQSGLFGDRFDDYGLGDDALARSVANFHTLRQLTPPGELWAYCNTGFQLAGAVIERLLDMPYEQALRERLTAPLGLERTTFFAHEAIVYPVAVGHVNRPEDGMEVARRYALPRCVNPAGGLIATAGDLLRFAAMHLNDGELDGRRILSPESARAMREPQTAAACFADAYGLGWAITEAGDTRIVGHGGSTNGFQARLTLVPDRRFALAILTNSEHGAAAYAQIERWALQHLCDVSIPRPKRVLQNRNQLSRFAGHYQRPDADIDVTVKGRGLEIALTLRDALTGRETQTTLAVAPVADTVFLITEGESEGERIDFIMGEDDRPRFIRLHGRLADRIADEPAATARVATEDDDNPSDAEEGP